MKTTTFKGTVESAYGKTLPKSVAFEGSFEAYETIAEVKAAKDEPTDEEIVDFRNAQRKANARSKSTTDALTAAGYEKPKADDPQVILANMIKQLKLSGKDEVTATSLAENLLGYAVAK